MLHTNGPSHTTPAHEHLEDHAHKGNVSAKNDVLVDVIVKDG